MNRIVIAGTSSGAGKTTFSLGLMNLLCKRGIAVTPFKVGPDYIDTAFASTVCGREAVNLDSFLLDEATLVHLFQNNASHGDIAVIEGVMGLYDGLGGDKERASTAHVASLLKAPILLLVDARGVSASAAAMVLGFQTYGKADIRGVVFNRVKSPSHYAMLKKIVERDTGVPVLGYLPDAPEFALQSRHLGLVPVCELSDIRRQIDLISDNLEQTVDIDHMITIAKKAPALEANPIEIPKRVTVRIGVAQDEAFHFYYHDNLELLRSMGAELVPFRLLDDKMLPDVDGLYLGGGFPEVFAPQLERNEEMRAAVRRVAECGMPIYGECGALMFLCDAIVTLDGAQYAMAGVLPGKARMTKRLQNFGYYTCTILRPCLIGEGREQFPCHEFHHSTLETSVEPLIKLEKNGRTHGCGYQMGNTFAMYPHVHFWSNPGLAQHFLDTVQEYQRQRR